MMQIKYIDFRFYFKTNAKKLEILVTAVAEIHGMKD